MFDIGSLERNLFIMLASGGTQVVAWYYLNVFISYKLGRTTKDDYALCIKEKLVGPAVIRLGIQLSTALMVYSAFNRNL